MVIDWFEGRTFNGQTERAAMYQKAKDAIALVDGPKEGMTKGK